MSAITVRGLDAAVIRALKVRAARDGNSMEAEVRSILTNAVRDESSATGFGTFLSNVFAGTDEQNIPIPDRSEFPAPIDLS